MRERCSDCGQFVRLGDSGVFHEFIPDTEFTIEEDIWTCNTCINLSMPANHTPETLEQGDNASDQGTPD